MTVYRQVVQVLIVRTLRFFQPLRLAVPGSTYMTNGQRANRHSPPGSFKTHPNIGPSEGIADQKDINEEYFSDSSQLIDLTGDDPEAVELSAWFRNYQQSNLAFALGVQATFLIQADSAHLTRVEIPYLEFSKPVRVGLASIPLDGDVTAMLISLTFYDFYDHKHSHVYGERSTNEKNSPFVPSPQPHRLTIRLEA